jgi:hypothetical protein
VRPAKGSTTKAGQHVLIGWPHCVTPVALLLKSVSMFRLSADICVKSTQYEKLAPNALRFTY